MSARAVYLDIHGVLLDFRAGYEATVGMFPDLPEHIRWEAINTPEWWRDLPQLESGKTLLRTLRGLASDLRFPIYALTRPMPRGVMGIPGTYEILQKLGFKFEEIVIAHNKDACAPGFLVDDEPVNLASWYACGGAGFLWPSTQNSNQHALDMDGAQNHLISALLSWCTGTPL